MPGQRSIVRFMYSRNLLAGLLIVTLAAVPVPSAAAASRRARTRSAVCHTSCVDLAIGISDGTASLVPGRATLYLVAVRNAGPSTVNSIALTDALPATLKSVVFAPLSGSYNKATHVWSGLNLASGRTVTMLIAGAVDPAATGTLVNGVTVMPPSGASETNTANNTASDTDTLKPQADLSVSETDGTTAAVPGLSTTYSLTVHNGGPSTVSSISLTDSLAPVLGSATFAPAAGSYNAATHLWSGLSLAAGQSATITLSGTISPAASGTLSNAVTVATGPGVTDPSGGNNSATDTDTLSLHADLSISESDGTASVVPGHATTYSIAVSNLGPSSVSGAAVRDSMPSAISSDTWTASNGTGGSGNISTTVAIPAGATVTYTVVANVSVAATGGLVNTASVMAPTGVSDTNLANNSATDTDELTPQAELSVTVTDGVASVEAGTSDTYTIIVSNDGPAAVSGASVTSAMPPAFDSDSWTVIASTGSSAAGLSGDGGIISAVTLLPGGSATYTLVAQVNSTATGTVDDSATVTPPSGITDPNTSNNTASDTDTITAAATCPVHGTAGCPWAAGDLVTYGQAEWASGGPATLLTDEWGNVYTGSTPRGFELNVGDLSGLNIEFLSAAGVEGYLPSGGPPAALTATMADPIQTSSGVYGGDVVGLQLDIDYSDAGKLPGASGLDFGDLTVCNLTDLTAFNGMTVRQIANVAQIALAGEPAVYTPAQLDPFVSSLSTAFVDGEITPAASNLFNGACP